jgi:hypothetical protein
MFSHSFTWSKLYLAVSELGTTDSSLFNRVRAAYWHLAPLNSTNTPPQTFERLKAVREEFGHRVRPYDEDDGTVTLSPLTSQMAVAVAAEIISMFDEVAKAAGVESVSNAGSLAKEEKNTAPLLTPSGLH